MVFSLCFAGRYVRAAACSLVFAASCVFAQTGAPALESSTQPLLPTSFSGWVEAGAPKAGSAPAAFDADNAGVLYEYGLKEFTEATYHHGSSEASLRAMRFVDATGAYGAYTFYRKPGMNLEAIGNGAAGDAHEIVFWSGTTVVDATFDASSGQFASSLKSLIAELPQFGGSSSVPPTLPNYLPTEGLDRSTVRYALGPAAYTRGGGVLPPDVIDFSRDAEVMTAQYSASNGHGTLTLIEYPTPQMAIHAETTLSALLKGPLPATLQPSNPAALGVRRSGPLVAVTSGNFSSTESQALLAEVKYEANVTWNRNDNTKREVKNAAAMLIGIAYLTAILAACALFLGTFLGGGRAVLRVMRGKPVSSVFEEDFISLHLSDWPRAQQRKLP
jgi:hypothetical protein